MVIPQLCTTTPSSYLVVVPQHIPISPTFTSFTYPRALGANLSPLVHNPSPATFTLLRSTIAPFICTVALHVLRTARTSSTTCMPSTLRPGLGPLSPLRLPHLRATTIR